MKIAFHLFSLFLLTITLATADTAKLVPLKTDPWCAVPLAMVAARLLRDPAAGLRFSDTTVAAYSLTPEAIRRLRAWQTFSG